MEDRFDRSERFLTNFLQSRDGSEDMEAEDSCSGDSEGCEPEEDRSPSGGSLNHGVRWRGAAQPPPRPNRTSVRL